MRSSNLSEINARDDSDDELEIVEALRTMVSMIPMPQGIGYKVNAVIEPQWKSMKGEDFDDPVGDRRDAEDEGIDGSDGEGVEYTAFVETMVCRCGRGFGDPERG